MKNTLLTNKFGITGLRGSGKTFVGKEIAKEAKIKYVELDDVFYGMRILENPVVRKVAEALLGGQLPQNNDDLVALVIKNDKKLTIPEILLMNFVFNLALKNHILKHPSQSILYDNAYLPNYSVAHGFNENFYVDGGASRFAGLMQRDRTTREQTLRLDELTMHITDYEKMSYSEIIYNDDRNALPNNAESITKRIYEKTSTR
jgi:dephospho-CoA kinase